MRMRSDYSSHFRILKGGRISLVVSALLISSAVVHSDQTISSPQTSMVTVSTSENVTLSGTGSISVSGSGVQSGIRSTSALSGDNTITIGSGRSINVASSDTDAYGIEFVSGYGYNLTSGHILNSGTIAVSGVEHLYGIFVNEQDNASSIINSGTMSLSGEGTYDRSYGIYGGILNGTAKVQNDGTITIRGYTGYGMAASPMSYSSQMVNSGTITVSADNGAFGMDAYQMYDSAKITNSGTISTNSSGNADGIGTYFMYGDSQIINQGSINIDSNNYGHGIKVDGYLTDNAKIINSGTINASSSGGGWIYGIYAEEMFSNSQILNTSTGNIDVTSDSNAWGIFTSYMTDSSSIVNNGHITVNSDLSDAFGIYSGEMYTSNTSITNSGTITVTGGSSASGIKVDYVYYGTINNSGTISANGIGEFGKSYGISAYSEGLSDYITVTNSGTISAHVRGAMDHDGYSLYVAGGSGSHIVNNTVTGKLYGNLMVEGSVTNAGLISLPYNANSTDGNTAYVTTFDQSATGKLEIGLMSGSDGIAHYSQLNTDSANFASGSTIAVNVLTASANQSLLIGQRMEDVVNATTSLTVGTLNITDNSALLNFELIEDANSVNDGHTIDLNIVEGTTITDATTAGGGGGSKNTAAQALDVINDDIANNPAMGPVVTSLNGLATNEEVAQAVASTTPVQTVSAQVAGTQIMNNVQGIVELRQNSTIGGGLNSGDMSITEQNLWVKPFGGKGEQENKDGINGFDLKLRGLGIGYDAEYAPNQRAGVAFFYTDADVDVKGMNQNSDVKVYNILAYGNVPLDATNNFLYQAGYAWQKNEGRRTDFMANTATSDYTSTGATIDLKLMQTHKINEQLTIHPLLNTTYRHFTTPSYSESGAGALNLNIEEMTSTQLLAGGGFIADYALDKNSYLMLDLSVLYDFHHDSETVTAAYQGSAGTSFTTSGIDNGPWIYNAGVGYTMKTYENSELNIMYNYQGQGTTFDVHTISAKYVWKF